MSQRLNCGMSLSAAAGRTAVRLAIGEAPVTLTPIHSVPSLKLVGRVSGELQADLTSYANDYRDVHSDAFRSPDECVGSPQHE
jgi:hypothetical protein